LVTTHTYTEHDQDGKMIDTRGQHPWLRHRAPHPLDPSTYAGTTRRGHSEGDAEGRAQGAGEDPARRVDELNRCRSAGDLTGSSPTPRTQDAQDNPGAAT